MFNQDIREAINYDYDDYILAKAANIILNVPTLL